MPFNLTTEAVLRRVQDQLALQKRLDGMALKLNELKKARRAVFAPMRSMWPGRNALTGRSKRNSQIYLMHCADEPLEATGRGMR